MDASPVHRVISIPLLLDSVYRHLSPRNIVPLVQVSKAFHNAFLPYRWHTLDNGVVGRQQGNSDFSRAPTAEAQGALVRYGASLTRQLVLQVHSAVLLHLLLREQAHCDRLQTIEHESLCSGFLKHFRLAWKSYDNVQDHPLKSHGRMYWRHCKLHWIKELQSPSPNTGGKGQDELSFVAFDSRFMTLMLAERNRRHLRKLWLNSDENRAHFLSVPFSIRCVQVVSRLENLQSLRLGQISEVTFMDIWQHLPSQVEELFWTTHWKTDALLYTSSKDLENDWIRYRGSVRVVLANYGIDDGDGGGGGDDDASYPAIESISREGDQTQTIHALMVSTAPKRRLHTLVLQGHFASRPPWLLNEILNHCPNLRSFTFPKIKLRKEDVDLLLESLDGLDHLSELHMRSLMLDSDEQYTRILGLFTAAGRNQPSQHSHSTMTEHRSHQQHQPLSSAASATRTLRSLTLPRSNAFGDGSFAALAAHYPTLEELRYCTSDAPINQQTVLNLLENCPRLRCFAALKDRWNYLSITMSWRDFVQSYYTTLIQSGLPPAAEAAAGDISLQQQPTTPALPENMRTRLAWPCTKTLTTLSLTLDLGVFDVKDGDPWSSVLQINQQLGQFKALEDLAVRCNKGDIWASSAPQQLGHPGNELGITNSQRYRAYVGAIEMDWTLEHGLGCLGTLKRMRRLNLTHANHRIGRPELEWMLENWPNLESLPGLFREKNTTFDKNNKEWILDRVQCP